MAPIRPQEPGSSNVHDRVPAVLDPAVDTVLPLVHWFIEPDDYQELLDHVWTDETEDAVLFFDGVLYAPVIPEHPLYES